MVRCASMRWPTCSRHPALSSWSWENVYQRPDLQLRAVVLMSRDNYVQIVRLVPDAAHTWPLRMRRTTADGRCAEQGARAGSPALRPKRWFGHVERFCLKSRAALWAAAAAYATSTGTTSVMCC